MLNVEKPLTFNLADRIKQKQEKRIDCSSHEPLRSFLCDQHCSISPHHKQVYSDSNAALAPHTPTAHQTVSYHKEIHPTSLC